MMLAVGLVFIILLAGKAFYAEKENGTITGLLIGWNLIETDKSPGGDGLKFGSTEKLRPRSSFSSKSEFSKSDSYETGVMAFKALPLALQCRNAVAVISIKLILGSVAEKSPNQIVQKTIRDIKRHPGRYPYTKSDCSVRLPAMMRKLKRRI